MVARCRISDGAAEVPQQQASCRTHFSGGLVRAHVEHTHTPMWYSQREGSGHAVKPTLRLTYTLSLTNTAVYVNYPVLHYA